jgi:hypothetical protein
MEAPWGAPPAPAAVAPPPPAPVPAPFFSGGETDPVAREVAEVRATRIVPAMEAIAKILKNYAGAAIEANRRYYTEWFWNHILATYRVRTPDLARHWRQVYAAVWDAGIAADKFPEMLRRYAQVAGVFDRIPWPDVVKGGGPGDLFAQCARAVPFWKGADGVPRSVINPRFYLDDGGYFPRSDQEIEVDMAVVYSANFHAILVCVQSEIERLQKKLERKIKRMQRIGTVTRVLGALMFGNPMALVSLAATEGIERWVAKDNPELAKALEIGVGIAMSALAPGSMVATNTAAQLTDQVLKQGVALMQAEMVKRAAREGKAGVAQLRTAEDFARELAGIGEAERDASLARWLVWVLETLVAGAFLDALAGRQGVALNALNDIMGPLKREAAGEPAAAPPGGAAPPEPGREPAPAGAAEGPGSVAAAVAVPAVFTVATAVLTAVL